MMPDGFVDAASLAGMLQWAKRSGGGFIAKCPTHEDRLPSLSIHDGKKGTVLHCHAGCRSQDIAAALGFTVAHLFRDFDARSGAPSTSVDMLLRDLMARSQPRPLLHNWMTLAQVMDVAFKGSVDDVMRAHEADLEADMMGLEFTEAFNMWHVVADTVVYAYMKDYLVRSKRSWADVRREAMSSLYSKWNANTIKEGMT